MGRQTKIRVSSEPHLQVAMSVNALFGRTETVRSFILFNAVRMQPRIARKPSEDVKWRRRIWYTSLGTRVRQREREKHEAHSEYIH